MYKLIVTLIFIYSSSIVLSAELEEGEIYRLSITAKVKRVGDPATVYTAMKNTKYEVISKDSNGDYIVIFDRIYVSNISRFKSAKWVTRGDAYILPASLPGAIDVTKVSKESLTGLSAGPLVVPFKYRTGDKSLSGDATIGMYAGGTWEPGCSKSNWCFRVTPLISAGLSQVSVANGEETESKTSATWATGFLVTNWADMNIGVIYGQDRIGDNTWEHEGDGWWSIMIGWEL